jgi:hypothetical protein
VIRIKEKIATDCVYEQDQPDLDDAVDGVCRMLDLPRPVVLRKHRNEFERFRRTRFLPDDFMEGVAFAGFELEELRDRKKRENRLYE